jgi:hypothetical protein
MPDGAQTTTGPSGSQQPEQQSVLGFPIRPRGDGEAVTGGRHHWYELAQEIHGAFADIDRAVASMQWSGDGRRAFDAAWSQLSGHGTEAAQHSQEMGDHLLTLGHQIDDAQHQWDMAMTAMAASTAIGIGLTFVTFGISDAVAEGAAAAAVGTMEAVCAALDISLEAAVQVMIAAIRIGVQLAVKFTWQFGISVVTQETARPSPGRSARAYAGGARGLDARWLPTRATVPRSWTSLPASSSLQASAWPHSTGCGNHDVRVPRPAGSQGIRNVRTADLDVSGVGHVDVYAPGPSTRANGIVSAILNKNSQASVVHVEIDATSVSESEMLRIPNRVFGHPSAGGNIMRIVIRHSGHVIVDSLRQ